jgi:hypothetical protein
MCAKLGITVIAASSPQAKGRIERMHGTHQDRLVKKLQRKQIASHQAANVYLRTEYLPEHNGRFRRAAELDRIFRLESERVVSQDWVVRYANRYFQLPSQSRHAAAAGSKVLVEIVAPRRSQGEILLRKSGVVRKSARDGEWRSSR